MSKIKIEIGVDGVDTTEGGKRCDTRDPLSGLGGDARRPRKTPKVGVGPSGGRKPRKNPKNRVFGGFFGGSK